jgi:hypothetical protein
VKTPVYRRSWEKLLQRLEPGHDRTASWFYQDRAIAGLDPAC